MIEVDVGPGIIQVSINDGQNVREISIGSGAILVDLAGEGPQGIEGPAGGVDSVNGETGDVILDKTDIGLGNVDNTTDADKPVSTATQTELNAKEPTITKSTGILSWTGAAWAWLTAIAATFITEDATHRFTTDTEKSTWNAKVGTARTISTTSPITGGGDLSADRTIGINESLINIAESQVTNLVTDLSAKEPGLGSPGTSGYILSSTTAGVRSWVAPGAGGGIPEAPVDGKTYGRKDVAWVAIPGGAGTQPRTATISTTLADEDTSQTISVVDASITAKTQFSIDYQSEDYAIQGVQAHILNITPGAGYTVIVVAPDGATGQIDLIVTAEEAS